MPLVEDDYVVQAFPPDGPDHPFHKRILPRRPWGSDDLLDAHGQNASTKHAAVYAVAIPDHVAWCRVPREGFADLLCHPRRGRVCRHTEMYDPPTGMTAATNFASSWRVAGVAQGLPAEVLRGCGRCHGEWRGGDRLSFACRKKYPAFSGKAKVPAGYEVFRRDTQTAHIYGILKGLLAELGGGLANIVKLTTFYVNPDDFSQMAEVRKKHLQRRSLRSQQRLLRNRARPSRCPGRGRGHRDTRRLIATSRRPAVS